MTPDKLSGKPCRKLKFAGFVGLLCLMLGFNLHAQVTTFEIDSSKFNYPLSIYLNRIYLDDQYSRFELFKCMNTQPLDQEQVKSIVRRMKTQDSVNLVKIVAILDQYGWLGPQDVGFNGSQAIFLVIQHAPPHIQKRYLPLLRLAEKEGKALSSNLAILEDRVALYEGRKQSYGSQVYIDPQTGTKYVQPLENPEKVDLRRKSMGMAPMRDYLENTFQMKWDVKSYKKSLPLIEQLMFQQ